jgi:cytochrome c peroxidase
MHDGSLRDLRSVIDHYSSGGKGHPNTDPVIQPLDLTEQEIVDMIAFLSSLTDEEFIADVRFRH